MKVITCVTRSLLPALLVAGSVSSASAGFGLTLPTSVAAGSSHSCASRWTARTTGIGARGWRPSRRRPSAGASPAQPVLELGAS